MKVYRTLVAFSDADGTLYRCDTIEYQGRLWLVPRWLESPSEGKKRPARLVCLDPLRHQRSANPQYEYLLNDPVPKALFDDQIPKEIADSFVVIERPEISLPIPKGIH